MGGGEKREITRGQVRKEDRPSERNGKRIVSNNARQSAKNRDASPHQNQEKQGREGPEDTRNAWGETEVPS